MRGSRHIRSRVSLAQFKDFGRNSQLPAQKGCATILGWLTEYVFQRNSPPRCSSPYLTIPQYRKLIADYNTLTEPLAVQARKAGRMRRRVFYAAGVNHIWAFDQHDKWQRYGLRHHIGVEPYTGRILWLLIWWNNSDPKVPARQYFKAIRETGGTKTHTVGTRQCLTFS